MSEDWRRRTYYRPRVLIDTSAVLSPIGDGILVCLTPAQLALVRPVLEYLHRRSTFASSYNEVGYLVPDDTDWDTLQATIAEMEDLLMTGCSDIVAELQAIAAAVQCLCTTSQAGLDNGQWGPTLTPVVEDYLDDGTLVPEDDNGTTVPIDADRCALAQLTYAFAYEMITEVVMPAQDAAVDVLLPLAMVALGIMLGGPVVGIPAAVIVGILWYLAEIAAEGQLVDLQNELIAAKEDLVCAVYRGLATDYRQAEANARDVIDAMSSASPTDKIVLRLMFAPFAIAISQTAKTAGTTWATTNVEAGYCADCDNEPLPFSYTVVFPPCTHDDWTNGWDCTADGEAGINGTDSDASDGMAVSAASNWDIELEIQYRSKFGGGWTVGALRLQRQDGLGGWETIAGAQMGITNTVAAGSLNVQTLNVLDYAHDGTLIRLQISGQVPQGDTNPWPIECESISLDITAAT